MAGGARGAEESGFDSTLIAAPPGAGKTTLLREMIAALSNGSEERPALRVGVVDERGRSAGMYRGVPQLDVGCHTDVLDSCPKAVGIPMLLRSANPQVIAVDEITEEADIRAMTAAANCAVRLLATIHAEGAEELRRKPLFRMLEQAQVFRRLVSITVEDGAAAVQNGGAVMARTGGAVLVLAAAVLWLWRYGCSGGSSGRWCGRWSAAIGEMESAIRWQQTPMMALLEGLAARRNGGTILPRDGGHGARRYAFTVRMGKGFFAIPDGEAAGRYWRGCGWAETESGWWARWGRHGRSWRNCTGGDAGRTDRGAG